MNLFTFHLSSDTFIAHTGKLKEIGVVYVQLDDYAFPDKEWTDFASNIIYWWMEAFINLFVGGGDVAKCNFMDGNYRFDIKAVDKKTWKIRLIAERGTDEIWKEGQVDAQQATESIVQIARIVAQMEKKKGNEKAADSFDLRIKTLLSSMQKSLASAS